MGCLPSKPKKIDKGKGREMFHEDDAHEDAVELKELDYAPPKMVPRSAGRPTLPTSGGPGRNRNVFGESSSDDDLVDTASVHEGEDKDLNSFRLPDDHGEAWERRRRSQLRKIIRDLDNDRRSAEEEESRSE